MEVLKLNEIERRMSDDLHWALTAPEVQRHSGKMVAVYKKRVVGVGTDRMDLVRQGAEHERCHWGDIAVVVVPGREDFGKNPCFPGRRGVGKAYGRG
jgi:hypothetical protein